MSKHFKIEEFSCKCCGIYTVNYHLQSVLELGRSRFGAPVTITSGTRCAQHNVKIGGSPNSKHLTGEAADIVVKGVSPYDVYEFYDSVFPYTLGLGRYDSFTHVDVRQEHARW